MQSHRSWPAEYAWALLSVLVWLAVCCRDASALTATPTATPTPRPCVGDCNQDEHVTIDELVAMVNVALTGVGPSACVWGDRNGDGTIDVSEIIEAVDAALHGCSTVPPLTPAVSPSPTGTPPSLCGNGRVEPPETCDDANSVNGDGCSDCRIEAGFTCVGEPSSCYFLECPEPNPTCSGGPTPRSVRTPAPPRATQRASRPRPPFTM